MLRVKFIIGILAPTKKSIKKMKKQKRWKKNEKKGKDYYNKKRRI
jgi:hypothetical protein